MAKIRQAIQQNASPEIITNCNIMINKYFNIFYSNVLIVADLSDQIITDIPHDITRRAAFIHASLLVLSHHLDYDLDFFQPAHMPMRSYPDVSARKFYLTIKFNFRESLLTQLTSIPVVISLDDENFGTETFGLVERSRSAHGYMALTLTPNDESNIGWNPDTRLLRRPRIDFSLTLDHILSITGNHVDIIAEVKKILNVIKSTFQEHSVIEENYNSRCLLGILAATSLKANHDLFKIYVAKDATRGAFKILVHELKRQASIQNLMLEFQEYPPHEIFVLEDGVEEETSLNAPQRPRGNTIVIRIVQNYIHAREDFYDQNYDRDFIYYKYDLRYNLKTNFKERNEWVEVQHIPIDSFLEYLSQNNVQECQKLLTPFLNDLSGFINGPEDFKALLDGLFINHNSLIDILPVKTLYSHAQYTMLYSQSQARRANILTLNFNMPQPELLTVGADEHDIRGMLDIIENWQPNVDHDVFNFVITKKDDREIKLSIASKLDTIKQCRPDLHITNVVHTYT